MGKFELTSANNVPPAACNARSDEYRISELKRDVVEREFNEISAMRPASLTPTQLALGRVFA